jgi:hypothetical protein
LVDFSSDVSIHPRMSVVWLGHFGWYKDNTNKLWSYIKSKGQEFIGVAPLKNQQGFLKSDNQSKANILNEQFKSVLKVETTHAALQSWGTAPMSRECL